MPGRRAAIAQGAGRSGPALLLSAALLAACQAQGPATAPAAPSGEIAAEGTEADANAGPDTAKLAALPPAPPPEPAVDDDPARLMGLRAAEVDALLGPPDLVRREPPAEVRQYSAEDCVFDVFLYDEAGSYRVTYIEARDLAAQRIAARPCLNRLLRARLAGTGG